MEHPSERMERDLKQDAHFQLDHLSFTYPGQTTPALDDISLTVGRGEFITLCGPSGCGKTTLLRQLKPSLAPHGARTGRILFEGEDLGALDLRAQSQRIGFVLQSPENQLVTDKVWHELAFGLESLGCESEVIRLRVAEMASFFGIQTWFQMEVRQLSGGQKQLLNLAAVMVMQPSVLLLDEPTSQLDPIAAADFLAAVGKVNRELGVTVLLTEHRLEEALPLSQRAVVMDGGRIIADGPPREVGTALRGMGHRMFLAMPAPMRIWAGVENLLPCPITVREGRDWLDTLGRQWPTPIPQPPQAPEDAPAALVLKDVWFRYDRASTDVVRGLSLTIPQGRFFALVGGNGTGKTTTLSLLSGLNKPYRGTVFLDGRPVEAISDREKFGGLLGILPQNPQALFVKNTVEGDLQEMLSDCGLSKDERGERVARVVALCELEPLLSRHPYDLSGGEQQRAALAKVLLLEPKILLLDEPTKGLDWAFKEKLAGILKGLQGAGATIVMVSHDVEFCARYADLCALFFDGSVVTQGPPKAFFAGNSFYTTAANRMARHVLPQAVSVEDVITACGGTVEAAVYQPAPGYGGKKEPPPSPSALPVGERLKNRKLSKRTLAAAIMILLLIPLTLWLGTVYLGDRKYYFISLLLVLETFIPFFLVFERRKPQARELVLLSILCAIAVAGRVAFFFLPQFKPMAALVIISAVAFGGESGFLVGALSMLCSNFYFGQGPWTPFQMFAMGIIGFLAGVLFRKGLLPRSRTALCTYGGLSVFFLYGIIVNVYTVFSVQQHITLPMILTACIAAIPMDLVHALSTVIFLWLAAPAMLDKLDRVKVKYGLVE